MLLYTIFPLEYIFDEEPDQSGDSISEVEIRHNQVSLMAEPLAGGRFKINRIISTNPQDYLNPDWQPGAILSIF